MRLDLIASEILVELSEAGRKKQECLEHALAAVVQKERTRCAEKIRSQIIKFENNPVLVDCLMGVLREVVDDPKPWLPKVIEFE